LGLSWTIVDGQRLFADNFSIAHEICNSWTIVEFYGQFIGKKKKNFKFSRTILNFGGQFKKFEKFAAQSWKF
jgi:hypothetical protein